MIVEHQVLTKSLFESKERTDTNKTKLGEEVTRTEETSGKNSRGRERDQTLESSFYLRTSSTDRQTGGEGTQINGCLIYNSGRLNLTFRLYGFEYENIYNRNCNVVNKNCYS